MAIFRVPPQEEQNAGWIAYDRSPVCPGIELLSGFQDATEWRVLHEHYEVVVVYDGSAEIQHEGRTFEVGPGTMTVFMPDSFHRSVRHRRTATYQALVVEPNTLSRLLGDHCGAHAPRFKLGPHQLDPEVLASCRQASRLVKRHAEPFALESVTIETFARTIETIGEPETRQRIRKMAGNESVAHRAKVQLNECFVEAPSLAEMAAHAGCSKFHLLRAFRVAFGLTPRQYVIQKRVALARRLLKERQPAAAVARQAGFCNQAHLNRDFKRIVGVTPRQYAGATTPRICRVFTNR